MLNVEQAIREVGAVYQALTGRAIERSGSELPPDVDSLLHLESRYHQFKAMLEVSGYGAARAQPAPWSPPVEISETDREVRCELDLPAVTRAQVSIAVSGDFLVVRGERGASVAASGMRRSERPFGPFEKVIGLPPKARRSAIEACLRDGVLVITVPTDGPGNGTTTIDVK
jgi:HSP20 family protein